MIRLLVGILTVLWALVLLLVGARFLTLLVDANRDSELVQWVLSRSEFWVAPFFGIFNLANEAVGSTGSVFEPASLVAFLVYGIVGGIILRVLAEPFGWYGGSRRHHPFGI
jgi:hypothetical protein